MMKHIIILSIFIHVISLSNMSVKQIDNKIERILKITSPKQDINVNGKLRVLDWERLLKMTAQVESRYGQDNYHGRIAKTPFQYEVPTVSFAMIYSENLKDYIESRLGHKLHPYRDSDSPYIAYLIYMTKMRYHKNLIDKYARKHKSHSNDIEWLVYKTYYNSTEGATTYKMWKQREKELSQR